MLFVTSLHSGLVDEDPKQRTPSSNSKIPYRVYEKGFSKVNKTVSYEPGCPGYPHKSYNFDHNKICQQQMYYLLRK